MIAFITLQGMEIGTGLVVEEHGNQARDGCDLGVLQHHQKG